MTKPAQQYINCFETIAQIALMPTCHALIPTRQHVFRLPTGSDNTGAEAGLNSLFTTAFPLSYFLRIAADWAHSKNIALECGHVPGEKNDWADDLAEIALNAQTSKAGESERGAGRQLRRFCSLACNPASEHPGKGVPCGS